MDVLVVGWIEEGQGCPNSQRIGLCPEFGERGGGKKVSVNSI